MPLVDKITKIPEVVCNWFLFVLNFNNDENIQPTYFCDDRYYDLKQLFYVRTVLFFVPIKGISEWKE